jgi:hypothetical protein
LNPLGEALRGAGHVPRAATPRWQTAVVIGAGGTLGSAVLAEALVGGRFASVHALAAGPWPSTLRDLKPLTASTLATPGAWSAELAFIVFERGRHANGRDEAFVMPAPADLLALARALHAGGARRLVVVLPHAPALLPQALKVGLATLDETAVAALGFEHLVFVRAAQALVAARAGSRLQRMADLWLAQLRWMVPQREQPVRAAVLAAQVVALARALPSLPPGTRVLPPEVLWSLAQAAPSATGDRADVEARLAAWWREGPPV